MEFTHGVTVMVRRSTPGGVDQYGDPVAGTTADHAIENVAAAPRYSGAGESTARDTAQGLIVGYTLYILDRSADILHTDLVQVYGRWCQVDAEPGVWSSPFNPDVGGLEVQATFASGV